MDRFWGRKSSECHVHMWVESDAGGMMAYSGVAGTADVVSRMIGGWGVRGTSSGEFVCNELEL